MRRLSVGRKEKDMWENKDFRVRLGEDTMKGFEKAMLSSGECSLFMPMGFINENGREYGCYDCSGFAPLNRYLVERTEDALYILENVLIILEGSIEYFIDPARVTLTDETVFYNKDTGQVKIAYIPIAGGDLNVRKNIVFFIGRLKSEICDGKEQYLIDAAKYIYYHNYRLREMVNKVGMLKRSLYSDQASAEPEKEE